MYSHQQVTWRKVGVSHFLSIGEEKWVKDAAMSVEVKEHTEELTEWNLVIGRVGRRHAGVYECRVTDNEVITRHVQLNVLGEYRG